MKKTLTILGVTIAVGAGLFGAYWAEEKSDWRQHHPITEISVNGMERKYHLFVPTNPPEGPLSLVVMLMGGDAGSTLSARNGGARLAGQAQRRFDTYGHLVVPQQFHFAVTPQRIPAFHG